MSVWAETYVCSEEELLRTYNLKYLYIVFIYIYIGAVCLSVCLSVSMYVRMYVGMHACMYVCA